MNQNSDVSFRNLDAWRASMDFTEEIYRLAAELPKDERYGLASQIKRAAVSIPSNIAEGKVSGSDAVFLRHVGIALGSVAELETQLRLIGRLGLAADGISPDLWADFQRVGKLVSGLHRKLRTDTRD